MTIPLFSWIFLIPIYYASVVVQTHQVSGQCTGNQQSLLLELKNSLNFEHSLSTKLVKWNNVSDYCSWEGVSCKEGCVTHLDLTNESNSGRLDNSSPLFSLQYIENLNLAYNKFNYTEIPSQLGKLTRLSNLNLSNAEFVGQIPIEISHLTRLVILDLSTFYFPGYPYMKLDNPNLSVLIGNLSELMELRLDGVNLSAQRNSWCQAISTALPKLRVLSLISCSLSGPIDSSLLKLHSISLIHLDNNNLSSPVPEFFSNFKNLTSLRFGNSGLYGTFPNKIFQLPTLQTIYLWGNPELQGSLPEFPKNGLLQSLVLSGTNFSGLVPYSIGDLTMLSQLDLSYCNFSGSIPKSVENLTKLVYLDMSGNKFNGSVPSFRMAKNLTEINLSYNYLTGQISTHWENLTNLLVLDLHYNLLDGSIPFSLFLLPSLEKILLSNNQFSGRLFEFTNISSYLLETLDLSSNNLEGPIPMSIFNLQGLKILSLSSNNFSGYFYLNGLQQLRNISSVDVSHNSLSISYEHHTNSSYSSFPRLTTLLLASGKLTTFPEFLRNQSTLAYLDLSENQISGQIPNWIWRLNLLQLNLSCNSLVTLEGPLLNLSSTLSVVDLHSNQLQGRIPYVSSPDFNNVYLDYSRNNLLKLSMNEMRIINSFIDFEGYKYIKTNKSY